ncbi:UNVERIFIED_CONTAM: hypothetical protein Slati_4297000 [Sesamum latifolium]|uniref:Endonuclease/exonuclease/phosphatase domain-containing protein n=1 Tax=Sesamum latifolium TaxID=2727402 RepID=A0AAW2TG61_9LAMI
MNIANTGHASNIFGRSDEMLSGKDAKIEAMGMKKTSFAGLFCSNRQLTGDNKLTKFAVEDGIVMLESNDLIDVRAKLGHCLIGYIADKFSGLKAIRALAQSWEASFQQHDSGCLIFLLHFKEDDINLTLVWAILPSLSLECWHPNVLGKIGSRLGTPIAMDSLTMKMERVSYDRILVEVDASNTLVDQAEFIIPNGVIKKRPIIYEFTPKFCLECNHFGHLKDSCQGIQPPAAGHRSMWEKLLELGQPLNMSLLILGDFNCVKSLEEKQHGATTTYDSSPVWCKLDRVLLNNELLDVDLHCNAHLNPPGCLSDHSSGIVSILDLPAPKPKPFRFFNIWADHPDFITTVENGWNLNMDGTP